MDSIDELHTTLLPPDSKGIRRRRLDQPFAVSIGIDGGGLVVTVPAGFETDFASIPRPLWSIFPPAGAWAEAAVVHDYLCGLPNVSRFLGDAIFRELMARLGVPLWKRVVMYYAVRVAWIVKRVCGIRVL